MIDDFTPNEKALLRELQMNSAWASILAKLRAFHRAPRGYKPGQSDAAEQERDWIYYSGVDRCRDDLLKLLGDE